MYHFSKQDLRQLLDYPSLIECLRTAFGEEYEVPLRHHHDFDNPSASVPSTLLLMPAWQKGGFLGVKMVTVSPENKEKKLPTVNGIFQLFDTETGLPLAQYDAGLLTSLRTAAASALASDYLSRKNSHTLLMIGTGNLAPFLIRAHATIRPIEKVFIWGRNLRKAKTVATLLEKELFDVTPISDYGEVLNKADIISVATLSDQPLVFGKSLAPGQHIDLVGSFKPDMREADNETILRSSVYADTLEGATVESGDLAIPIKEGILKPSDIHGDLFDLCRREVNGRNKEEEITLFKSVGLALEDLAAATLAYRRREMS